MFSVKNKNIIVTGASGVLGSAISNALAKKGARLAILGRNPEKIQNTFDELNEISSGHLQFACDVLDVAALEKINDRNTGNIWQN